MEQIGWSLVDQDGTEIQHWGETLGQCRGIPDVISLPNGDAVHCPAPGLLQEWSLVPRMHDYGVAASVSFNSEVVVVMAVNPPLNEQDYSRAIQQHVDDVARSRGYQDGFALVGYVSSTVEAWAAEASTFAAWRDQVWLYAYAQLAAVQAQTRSQPTISELIAELPSISWPK